MYMLTDIPQLKRGLVDAAMELMQLFTSPLRPDMKVGCVASIAGAGMTPRPSPASAIGRPHTVKLTDSLFSLQNEVLAVYKQVQFMIRSLEGWSSTQAIWLFLRSAITNPDSFRSNGDVRNKFESAQRMCVFCWHVPGPCPRPPTLVLRLAVICSSSLRWKGLTQMADQERLASVVLGDARALSQVETCLSDFERVHQALLEAVNERCHAFPRLFFLSSKEILAVVAFKRDLRLVQATLSKCFADVRGLRGRRPRELAAVVSSQGEIVGIDRPLRVGATLDVWAPRMLRELQHKVRGQALSSFGILSELLPFSTTQESHVSARTRQTRRRAASRGTTKVSSQGPSRAMSRADSCSSDFVASSPLATGASEEGLAFSFSRATAARDAAETLHFWMSRHTAQACVLGVQLRWASDLLACLSGARTRRRKDLQRLLQVWERLLALARDDASSGGHHITRLQVIKQTNVAEAMSQCLERLRFLAAQKVCAVGRARTLVPLRRKNRTGRRILTVVHATHRRLLSSSTLRRSTAQTTLTT